jgi:aryl-alcohol dehydrogenase-like predicted oxidoreductase
VVVATTCWPLVRTVRGIRRTIGGRRDRLRPFAIGLCQACQPFAWLPVEAQMNVMADLVEQRLVRTVGVSGFPVERMRAAHAALAGRAVRLVSNQVPYNLLDRHIETNGVLAAARELNVTIIARSPLAQGLLTGKIHGAPAPARTEPGRRLPAVWRERRECRRRVVAEVEAVAAAHGATPAQVALSWLVQFHRPIVVAMPGAGSVRQARENARALQLGLTASELVRLDEVSRPFLTAR